MASLERLATGIPGLDQLIGGGIPRGFNVLIVGLPGSGKSIFGLQYLYNGALQDENGLYIALDSTATQLRAQASNFGWDFEKLEQQNKLHILEVPLNKEMRLDLFQMIVDRVKEWKIERIVFDNLSSFMFNINQFILRFPRIDDLSRLPEADKRYLGENPLYRQVLPESVLKTKPDPGFVQTANLEQRMIYLTLRELAALGTTNLIIESETYGGNKFTVDGVSEFVCDGVMRLDVMETATQPTRVLRVLKMRVSKTVLEFRRFNLDDTGITIS